MPFISSCLIVLARTPARVDAGPLTLFLVLEEKLSFSRRWVAYALGVAHTWLLLCWCRFFFPLLFFFYFLNHKIMFNFFSVLIEMIPCFFPLTLLCGIWQWLFFHVLNHPCIVGINPTWSYCVISLWICCWIPPASVFWRVFASGITKDIGPSFSCSVFVWLWFRAMLASKNVLGSVPLSSIFWKRLRRKAIRSL